MTVLKYTLLIYARRFLILIYPFARLRCHFVFYKAQTTPFALTFYPLLFVFLAHETPVLNKDCRSSSLGLLRRILMSIC